MNKASSPPVWGIPDDHDPGNGEFRALAELWHLPSVQWSKIWSRATGKGVRVCILDTGIVDHQDLPTPVLTKSFIRGESVRDGNGHGTHVAGIAVGRNGIGVAPEAELMVGKVLSNSGSGSSQGISDGIRWAADNGAHVVSMSLGGGSSFGPTNANIDYCFERGVIVNAAAGNSGDGGGSRNTIGWPAKYRGCLCNAASQKGDTVARFSSSGDEVDWITPGHNIVSASNRGGLVSMSGTSMATPFGSGCIALWIELMIKAGHAQWTAADTVREFFRLNSRDIGAPGKDRRAGHGMPMYQDIVDMLSHDEVKYS